MTSVLDKVLLSGNGIQQLETDPSSPWAMGLHLLGIFVVLGLVVLHRKFIDRRSLMSLGFDLRGQAAKDLLAGLLYGFAVITAVFLILWATGGLTIVSVQFPIGSLLGFGALLVLVAVEEEAACRGYLLLNFMESMGKGWALVVSSVLFAGFHLMNPNASVIGLINIVIAGLFLGVYYIHRKNLWFPIGIHFTWNFFQGVIYGSPVSGLVTGSVLTLEFSGNPYLTGGEFGFEASLVTTVVTGLATLLVHLAYRTPETAPPQSIIRPLRIGRSDRYLQRCGISREIDVP